MNNKKTTINDLAEKLNDPRILEIYNKTYKSIIDRVENDGYFQESVNGAYIGMFPRTVGGLVSLFCETGELEKSRKLVDFVLKSTKANNMHRVPHVIGRKIKDNVPVSSDSNKVSVVHDIALYKLNDDFGGALEIIGDEQPIVAIEVWLSSSHMEKPVITCSISESLRDIDGFVSKEYTAESTFGFGKWIRFKFDKPVNLAEGKKYYIHIRSTKGTDCIWWGTIKDKVSLKGYGFDPNVDIWYEGQNHQPAFAINYGDLKHKKITEYPVLSRMDQLDGNFHVLTAWAMVVLNSDVKKWENSTYDQIVDLTNTAIDSPYLFPKAKRIWPGLIHNFCLEHSREGRYWDTWDILTQSWACRGLRLLADVANRRGDSMNAAKWTNTYRQIEDAIKENLTMEVDGKTVYAEMRLTNGGDGVLFGGLSWVNLAPVQAQWNGADSVILRNTVYAYRNKAKINWHGRTVTGVQWTPGNSGGDPQVIGKGVGWDIAYSVYDEDYATIINWLDYIKAENYTELYAEAFNLIDGKTVIQDPGNGEQISWWCWGISKARKAAGLPAVP